MHPLISAYLRLREVDEVEPSRPWSPYHPVWAEMRDQAHAWYWELMEVHR